MAVTIWPRKLIKPRIMAGGQRHAGHFLVANDFLDLEHLHAEEQAVEKKSAELFGVLAHRMNSRGCVISVESGVGGADDARDIQQVGDFVLNDRRAQDAIAAGLAG